MTDSESPATQLLSAHAHGDPKAAAELLPLVYEELRNLASQRMQRNERGDHTLQPTALVHEAYLRLIDCNQMDWRGKTHFLAMAAKTMRRVLIEHARARTAQKRGGGNQRMSVESADLAGSGQGVDLLALEDVLAKLTRLEERQARVVELRFFGGLSVKETAAILGVSGKTVKQDWRLARAWLHCELGAE